MSTLDYLKDKRILVLVLIVAMLAVMDLNYGIHFGIEFSGGTQIPLVLEHTVNATTMSTLITDLSQRVSTFGLKQVTVEGVGSSQVYVIVPSVSSSEINQTLNIIQSQGRFLGVVNGKEALNGSDILKGSVGSLSPQQTGNIVSWAVSFYINQQSTSKFAKAVFGAANQPLYMFLDRPTASIILLNQSIMNTVSSGISSQALLASMQDALSMGNDTIPIMLVSNTSYSTNSTLRFFQQHIRFKTVYASYNLNPKLINALKAMNLTVKLESNANMTPDYTPTEVNSTMLNSWSMVGLLSAPLLNSSLTNGTVGDNYEISGSAPFTLSKTAQYTYANSQEKTIMSILNGGALPVSVITEPPTTIPPTLGKQALYVSGLAGVLGLIAISAFITLRYKKPFLVLPILLTTFTELFIIVSIIGMVGTIDLAAVAGMIAVVGTGVDSQIIITDEILRKGPEAHTTAKSVLSSAFSIIWIDALLLVVAMLPLFFTTSMVTVIGFSESTIIGALLGVLVTRPAYGALLERHFSKSE